MTTPVLHLRIQGIVQGVSYRWTMVQAACRLGVGTWVRNRADGTVEAMVAGPQEALDQIIEWARRGPPGAVVRHVDVTPGDGEFDTFEQHPSA